MADRGRREAGLTPWAWMTAVSVSGSVPSDLGRGVRAVVEVDADLAARCRPGRRRGCWSGSCRRRSRMMPEPEPEPLEPLDVDLDHGGQDVRGRPSRSSRWLAAGTAELPLWVMIGDEATGVVVGRGPERRAADAGGAADEQAGRHDGGGQALAAGCSASVLRAPRPGAAGVAGPSTGAPKPNGRVSSAVSPGVWKPYGDQVAGGAGGSGVQSWLGCGSCPPCGDSLLMPLTLAGESVTFLRHRWAPSKKAAAVRRRPTRTTPPCTTRAFRPRSRSRLPSSLLTNATASSPNRARNFLQPACGLAVTSRTTSSPICDPSPGRQVVVGEVEVDVELVAGQRALVVGVAEQPDHPAAHHRDLRVEVASLGHSRARWRGRASCRRPRRRPRRRPPRRAARASSRSGRRTTSESVPASAGAARRWSRADSSSAVGTDRHVIDPAKPAPAVRRIPAPGDSRGPQPPRVAPVTTPWARWSWELRSCGRQGHVTWQPDRAGARRPAARRDRRR